MIGSKLMTHSTKLVAKHYCQRAGFVERAAIACLRRLLPHLHVLVPHWANLLCMKIYLTPRRSPTPAREGKYFDSAARDGVRVGDTEIACYTWGKAERRVLLCHAWGGRATQLGAFTEHLLRRGFQVVAFDAPAHGRSGGRNVDLVDYAATIDEIRRAKGPFQAIVGHSYGAGSAAFASRDGGADAAKLILIGCFADGLSLTERFGAILNVPSGLLQMLRDSLAARNDRRFDWNEFDICRIMATLEAPVMVVHDRHDVEIPYENAVALTRSGTPGRVHLLTTEGLGHRRIVRDPEVLKQICDFIEAEEVK
jgi:pimeloyl-ACP methyl ester carboxylesterase